MENNIKSVPLLVSAGIFDSSLLYSQEIQRTKNRHVSLFEIELPMENAGCSHINSCSYRVRKNTVLCAKPGQIRHSELPYRCLFVHFIVKDEHLEKIYRTLPDIIEISDYDSYRQIFDSITEASLFPTAESEILIQTKMFELLYKLMITASKEKENTSVSVNNSIIVNKAVEYLDTHFNQDISLADVSEHVHLSRIYFHNLFKVSVGETVHNYLLKKRIEYAKKLLATTDFELTKIAIQSGFSSQSYFNYVFKRKTNYSPKQYRTLIASAWERDL